MENKIMGENTYPPLSLFFVYSEAMKIKRINMNHARKRYFDISCSNMLIIGQLKKIMPNRKSEIQISRIIKNIIIKPVNLIIG
jgi:hypothetical protein